VNYVIALAALIFYDHLLKEWRPQHLELSKKIFMKDEIIVGR
jgi:hypothetical protein